jgi:hypothetical protein
MRPTRLVIPAGSARALPARRSALVAAWSQGLADHFTSHYEWHRAEVSFQHRRAVSKPCRHRLVRRLWDLYPGFLQGGKCGARVLKSSGKSHGPYPPEPGADYGVIATVNAQARPGGHILHGMPNMLVTAFLGEVNSDRDERRLAPLAACPDQVGA